MTAVFLHFLNLSITAGWMVLAVLLLRLCLKKAPRWITCVLWGLVALRLIVPFTIESPVSLIPTAQTVVSTEDAGVTVPVVDSGVSAIDKPLNDWLQTPVNPPVQSPLPPVTNPDTGPDVTPDNSTGETDSTEKETDTVPTVSRMERILNIAAPVWLVGIGLMLLYELLSVLRVRSRVLDAVRLRDNVWQSDRVTSPFIFGLFRPRIYIPYGLEEPVLEQVLSHEQAHLHRRDHWIKPFAFTLLAVYWYNPLLWVGYILLCRDIEVACDERVVRGLDEDTRRQYATALLQCGVERRSIAACPLAFGEVSIKQRIKSVLNYRKPLLWVIIASLVICSVAAVCLLTVPKSDEKEEPVIVLSSKEIEPDFDRTFHGTDTDGALVSSGFDWLWEHAENPEVKTPDIDMWDETNIPLVVSRSKADLDALIDACSDETLQVDMRDWFESEKYDDTYFEDKVIVWLFVPGYDLGRYDYTVNLEETNKGLRYAVTLQYYSTSMFDPSPDRCEHLLMFEADRKVIEDANSLSTRHERAPIIVPTEEDNWAPLSIGNVDLDGDGEEESIRIFHSPIALEGAFMVVCKADGTAILRETIYHYFYSQCYLVPQDDGSSLLLFVEADERGTYYACESFGVLSLKDDERTVLDYRYDGRVVDYLDLGDIITYVQSLSGWMEKAQLLFECENGSLYYGDELGDTPRYQPLCWFEEYRESEQDTMNDVCESILASFDIENMATVNIDLNQDGEKEAVSVVRYGSPNRFGIVMRKADNTLLDAFRVYTYLDVEDLNHNLYFYLLKDTNGKEQLLMVEPYGNGSYDVEKVTLDGLVDIATMTLAEWIAYVEETDAELLFYIHGLQMYFPDEDPADNYLNEDPYKYAVENYNESIVAYNAFLKGQRVAYEFGDFDTKLYVSDLYADMSETKKGVQRYTLADVTGDGVPELITSGEQWNVFSYLSGRLLRLYESSAGMFPKMLSNGCLWEWRSGGGGNTYRYTKFFDIGTTRTVQFGKPDNAEDQYYVDDVWMNKADFDAKTATYFANAQSPALLIWYDYETKQPTSQAMVQYLSLLQAQYSDYRGAYYILHDISGDGEDELLILNWDNQLLVYTKGSNQAQLLVEQTFSSGTIRFFATGDAKYPGLIYFCVGGGKNQYYYLTLDNVQNKEFVKVPLWTDNYGFYEEGEEGRITELSDDKKLIELSRQAYQNNLDLAFSLYGGSTSTIALDRKYQQALHAYSSDSKNHRDVGSLQPETQDIILIDGKYYQTCVASNVDVRYVWLSQYEADIGAAYWDWVVIGTEEDYSLSNIGQMDYVHHVPVALQPVVGNRQTFIYQGESILLSDVLSQYNDKISRYAVVDFEGDGKLELAVQFKTQAFILVLWNEADTCYGDLFSFRSMYQINTDGTVYWNSSAGDYGCSREQFSGDTRKSTELWRVERDGNDVIAYYVDGKKVSETQFESLTAETKNEVWWYEWD